MIRITAFLLVLAGAVAAQEKEKFTFRFVPKAGDVLTVDQKTNNNMTINVQGNEIKVNQKESKKSSIELVEVKDGVIVKRIVDTTEDITEGPNPMSGEDEKKEGQLHGKKVTVTLKGDEINIEGLAVPEKKTRQDLVELDKEKGYLPKKPVAVGESWDIEDAEVKKLMNDHNLEGKIKLTLKEVKEIDKRKCAIVTAVYELSGKSDEGLDIELKAEGEVTVWIERGYMLSNKMTGKLKLWMGEKADNDPEGTGTITVEVTRTVKEK